MGSMTTAQAPHTTRTSMLPPAQPAYVLRGHTAQIHAVHFSRGNLRLITGDADGWVVLWNVPIKRPVAVWRAHNGTILGIASWQNDKIITHGRDNKLHVWQLKEGDEPGFSTLLPIEDAATERKPPWLLHTLVVNALNFCSFATTIVPSTTEVSNEQLQTENILVATPGVQDGHINVTSLPNESRVATIPSLKATSTGMVMAIGLQYHGQDLSVLAGYESGHVAVWKRNSFNQWQTICVMKAHSQPVLSLDIAVHQGCFFTSSVDAIIARHPLSDRCVGSKTVRTKHAGQQSLRIRSDEELFATAGWDGRARVYSATTMKELAVLKWHKEGCYALAFADVAETTSHDNGIGETGGGLEKCDLTVSEQRTAKARSTHWLAVGSKDGKVSLWDIY